jgi:excinuclease UvrABC nuclease subunit
MTSIEIGDDLAQLDAAVDALPNSPAVFLLWPKGAPSEAACAEAAGTGGEAAEGEPYLSKTNLLRRRLLRLLKERERPSRLLNLRHNVRRIEYCFTGSAFESALVLYEQARRHFPGTYLDLIKLRMPPYVKIVLANQFPRSHITTHLARSAALYFGPFRSRVSAERFEGQFLDLFQLRRCQEDLVTSPQHPGCIYGEMAMCLRPCQEARVVDFLRTDGQSLLGAIAHSRDRLSEEMRFEEAARQHKRYEKVQEVLKSADELARDIDRLNGVAVTRSLAADAVEMWFVREGWWQEPQRFSFEVRDGTPVSLDRKLRETFAAVAPRKLTLRERQEYLALLARWYYSSWRDGEWLGFESYGDIPYRKLVNAVARVAAGK